MPGGERDDAGILEGSPSEAAHESRFRSGVAAEPARVHIALPHAILQGYLPAPSRGLSRGTRRGKQRFLAGRLGHDGAIARQIIRPVHGTDAERLADQKSLETRAVDKKVTLNFSAIGQRHASDETVVPLHHPCHFAPDALESVRFGVTAQIAGHQQCIDMQRIVCAANGGVTRLGRREEPAIFSHDIAGRKIQQ